MNKALIDKLQRLKKLRLEGRIEEFKEAGGTVEGNIYSYITIIKGKTEGFLFAESGKIYHVRSFPDSMFEPVRQDRAGYGHQAI